MTLNSKIGKLTKISKSPAKSSTNIIKYRHTHTYWVMNT